MCTNPDRPGQLPEAGERIPDRRLSRRGALKVLGAGTLGAGMGAGLPEWLRASPAPSGSDPGMDWVPGIQEPVPPVVQAFPLQDVSLLESPFLRAQERDARYMLELDPDRLLHNFRINAGLKPRAPVYGGWESQEPWVDIRCHGHTLGHWLTAGSLMFASTGDERFKDRLRYIVSELRACQRAAGTGLVCAFPDGAEQLENAVTGQRFVGVPWYTLHKIMAGLRDAHGVAGDPDALTVLMDLADWVWDLTVPMSQGEFQRMLRREHGGMNEILADLFVLTDDERHLDLAIRFCHLDLLDPLAAGEDRLDGLHSNTQIPKVIGFQRLHELTGEPRYGAASRFFWRTVVQDRSFVTGGHGDVEHFFPPSEFPDHLGSAKTMETCCTYNMLRLTRMLFAAEPDAMYADFYERGLYNGILASQDPESGWNTYFQATRPGYMKLYHTPIDSFWCCTGSGLENHAKYGDSIYFHGPDDLFLNLFIPSVVEWKDKGITLRQETEFPEADLIRLGVTAGGPVSARVNFRYPSWSSGAGVWVNGEPVPAEGHPGSFIPIQREWQAGDVVELRVPMSLRAQALPGEPERVAFLYGPVVLAGRLGREGLYDGADILRNERTSGMILNVPVEVPVLRGTPESVLAGIRPAVGEAPLTFETVGIGSPRDVTLIPYYRLHHERYNLYWNLRS